MFQFVSSPKITNSSNDDCCDILYEKIARSRHRAEPRKSAVQNQDHTSELNGSEYPSYVEEELALFRELKSQSAESPVYVELPDRFAEETMDHRIEILGDGRPVNTENPENDTMDCEAACDKSAESPDPGIERNAETYLQEAAPQNDSPKNWMKEFNSDLRSIMLAVKRTNDQKQKNRRRDDTSFYGCEICLTSLTSPHDLEIHLMNHTKDAKGEANIHTKSVNALTKLGSPVNTVKSKKQTHICKICRKKLKGRFALFHHNNIAHADVRPYQCQLCEKNYTRSTHLRRHKLRIHKNGKTCRKTAYGSD